ncbi:phosphoenolpyruvate-protein phosphotransferase [Luminiphilus syltensis NOR5-1B]|uniref:phosphoenolpyruvate--protein phosphotransferase n=1 Tax=Luminiphilus syltensis NOR5-1B TaxID=565045 RepID=B8KU43_9GAMM|nr:phosphoenolpyruvate--protein phosphotransferase [Luminiphilus syltensis]EED34848.1 phosphoenolpyruvate-protein phosphotransferase [Luminiphilus syltensis NOR5-1B]
MIETLRKIVQAVNNADSLEDALGLIVRDVRAAMNTQVCTIYLLDTATNRLLFRATEGLNTSKVGKFSLGFDEGLVGHVATRGEPLNLDNAMAHPSFQLVPGLGEEPFEAFLGAPIIHQRALLGVLVVQQAERRRFSDDEEAFLITVSAQLAGVIAHAEATGAVSHASATPEKLTRFVGVPGSPGIAIGTGVLVSPAPDLQAVPSRKVDDRKNELRAFRAALSRVRDDIEIAAENLREELGPEDHALFGVYLGILDDSTLGGEVASLIKEGEWAQGALSQVMLRHIRHFERMEHSYLRERAVDVRDLGTRVLAYLQDDDRTRVTYPENTVLVAEEITASALGEIPRDRLAGVVSMRGSANCHAAILCRAMGVPAVLGAAELPFTRLSDRDLVIDGYNGTVMVNPRPEVRRRFEQLVAEEEAMTAELAELRYEEATTLDGKHLPLWVNTAVAADVQRGQEQGAEGVGLYRSEVSFLVRDRFPSEEEQRQLYRNQLEAFAPAPVTMRTLDVGGDKPLPYFPIEEDNPFLGWRGVRVTLDHPEIFLSQVRAMLKANEGLGNLRILLPMISGLSELEESQTLIRRCHEEVLNEGCTAPLPPIGVMIEVPSAVFLAPALARNADFFSVGSNDLTQYLLAVDRNNPRVADLYNPLHPAVLSALLTVVEAAHTAGIGVSICGELAGDARAAPLLLAMGFDQLSMNAASIPRIKQIVRSLRSDDSDALLQSVLKLDSPEAVVDRIDHMMNERGLTRFIKLGEQRDQ